MKKNYLPFVLILFMFSYLTGFSQMNKEGTPNVIDDPNLDQIPKWYLEQTKDNVKAPSQVITIDDYDNFYLGLDFAESHISSNPLDPTQFFTAFNIDGTHRTQDGHDWNDATPVAWGTSVNGDPVTAYDGLGNLYYENMFGGITGCKVVRSANNGLTWSASVTAISGNDKNWIAADQTTGPYANYVYTVMTNSGSGNFSRSTDFGATWTNTFAPSTQSLPGMMVCVGAFGATDGGAVYVVTNGGSSFASTYTFYRSLDGGATFSLMSAQNFAGYVGTNVSGRNSVENMRTRPYPFIAADNSNGSYRGRLYLVYASNWPAGDGNKPDVWCRYSDNGGATWSSAVKINDDPNTENNHQWAPAPWCDLTTGRLYVHWMDTRDTPASDSALIYASYSDNGGASFVTNKKLSNEKMIINCSTCGGGGTPRYQGDYTSITSNSNVSMSSWADFRWGSFASITAYFPDYAMRLSTSKENSKGVNNIIAEVPDVKLYTDDVIFTTTVETPPSGSFSVAYPSGNTLSSFPGSIPIQITDNSVPAGNYTVTVTGKGPNGTPVHIREIMISVVELAPPVADFVASNLNPLTNTQVNFTDLSTNAPTSWSWSFTPPTVNYLNGTTNGSENPQVEFLAAGNYTVSLIATNIYGSDTETKTNYINVIGCPVNSLPWFEGFEDVGPTTTFTADDSFINGLCNWSYDMVNDGGRLRFEAGSGFYHSGSKAATLDRNPSGGDNINYLITELDLSTYAGADNLELSFYYMHHGEESSTNDRVWVRGSNTDNWVQIYDLYANQGTAGNWNNVPGLDIDDILLNAVPSQLVSSTFQIRFGQQDNFPATSTTASDGYTFDDIAITGSLPYSYTWTGTFNTNWNEPSNWSDNVVPTISSDVVIPASAPQWPVISGNLDIGSDCNRIEMNGQSELTVIGDLIISTGKQLNCISNALIKVGGDWTNSGTFNKGTGTVEFYGTNSATISGSVGGSSGITEYAVTTFPVGMTDVTGASAGPSGDDGTLDVGIGFTFNYDGVDYTQARINTNGWVSLNLSGSGSQVYNNTYLFDGTDPNTTLAPWWDDLNATGGAVYYKTEGSSPNQVFIVEWNGMLTYYTGTTSTVTFQLRLYETSNIIEFHYGAVGAGTHSTSESASIGIEDATGGSNHFVEATTQSNTVGVTNLVSPADWPAINYRFTYSPPPSINEFHNLTISKENIAALNDANLNVSGDCEIKPNAWFTNGTGNSINIAGNLLIEANSFGMASYLDDGTTTVIGQTFVEQYLSSERWHLVSPPVAGATINTYFDIYLKEYNEDTDTWTYLFDPTTIPMNVGQGYSAWASDAYTGSTTVSFPGTLISSDVIVGSLDYTPAAPMAGFNLAGNPYACAIDWNTNWPMSNLSGWMVVYDNGTSKGYHTDGTPWNGKTDGIIPSTQGFWVRALNGSASLTIPASERLHNGQAFYKENPKNIYPEIRLEMEINGYSDETVVVFHPEATEGFDGYYDLTKFDNVVEAPQLFSIMAEGNYAVNFYDPDYQEEIIPVGFRTEEAGLYTITASSIENFDEDIVIYLEDLITGSFINLTNTPEYEFGYDPQDEEHRFNLHFTYLSVAVDEIAVNNIRVYSADNIVFITNPDMMTGNVFIYDMMGKEIYHGKLLPEQTNQIGLDHGLGHYIVKVITDSGFLTGKVLIK